MKWVVILVPLVCLAVASKVLAQEETRALILAPSEESSPGERSPQTAFWLSFLGTAIPVGVGLVMANNVEDGPGGAIFAVGATLGPSLGHFYSGCPGRALLGIGIRGGAMAVFLVAASTAIWEPEGSSADAAVVAGFLTFCASGIIDIATAPASARKTNRELEAHRIGFMGTRMRSTGEMALGLQYSF